jgi:hypothetical protein
MRTKHSDFDIHWALLTPGISRESPGRGALEKASMLKTSNVERAARLLIERHSKKAYSVPRRCADCLRAQDEWAAAKIFEEIASITHWRQRL